MSVVINEFERKRHQLVSEISLREFGEAPKIISRMRAGICNDQVLTKIEGRDIGDVIETLSDEQLSLIAKEVSRIFRQLRDVPTNGRFGVLWGDERELVNLNVFINRCTSRLIS